MNERLKQACSEFARAEEYLVARNYGEGYEAIVEHFYKLALEDVRKDVNGTINALKKQNPDPLGSLTQVLAYAEIEALKTVIDSIDNLTK